MTTTELKEKVDILEKAILSIQKIVSSTTMNVDFSDMAIKNITPYMESKKAYIGDTSCVFDNVKVGNTTAFMVSDNGLGIPCTIARSGDSVVVSFEKLEEVATVTISVL